MDLLCLRGPASSCLESREHAEARGANIYCSVAGYGRTGDAYHITAPDESAEQSSRGMALAVEDAGLDLSQIDYINAHGTSTPYNDKGETKAIKKVFGQRAYDIAVSSSKSMTGHMLGATGAVESIVCALAIRDGVIPPTINYQTPDPDCDLDYVPNQREMSVYAALNNSLGFGGHNTTLCFKKPIKVKGGERTRMLLGFAELLILGFVIEWVCRRCSLPGLVGMLALGLLVGVSGF